jgi:hypothetical protein
VGPVAAAAEVAVVVVVAAALEVGADRTTR